MISKGVEAMTPEQIQKKLAMDVDAWLDHCEAKGLKEPETALTNAEALGEAGIDQATFDCVVENLIRSFLFGFQHMVLLTVSPHVKTSPTVRTNL